MEPIAAAEPAGRGVRWVRLEHLHLTIRFLGPTPGDRIDELAAAMAEAAAAVEPFEIRIGDAGAFPATGRPRTLWLAIRDGEADLGRLAGALDGALVRAGWQPSERPFRAHLTLARADGVRRGPQTVAALRAAAASLDVATRADRLVLFESVTGGGPARYVALAEARLGGDASVLRSDRPRVGLRNRRQGAPHTS